MTTREQAIEVLNAAKLAGDGNAKVDHLRGLMELVVRKEPALLPEFLPGLLELQVDPSPAVRRFLADFVDAAVAASPTPAVLQHSLVCLRGLLANSGAATAKRALQSCYPSFRTAYTLVALLGGSDDAEAVDALRALWVEARALKAAVAGMATAAGNDAVRVAAAKFLEQSVLLLTADLVPAVAGVSAAAAPLAAGNAVTGKAALVQEAEGALTQLMALLKQAGHAGQTDGVAVSGPLASTLIRGAAGIAQQRPQFMGRVLPPLLALANSGAFAPAAAVPADGKTPGAGALNGSREGSGSQLSGIGTALSSALMALARSTHPTAQPWKKKIRVALEAMGVGDAASQPTRPDKRAQPSSNEPNKRPKLDSPSLPNQLPPPQLNLQPQQVAAPAQLQAPLQQSPPLAAGAPAAGSELAAPVPPPVTPPEQLSKVLVVLQALVARQDAGTLAGVVGSLAPSVLADVVMAYMGNLPPRHTLPPDPAPLPPWLDALLQLVASQTPLPTAPAAAEAAAPTVAAFSGQPQLGQPIPSGAAEADGGDSAMAQDVQQQQATQQQTFQQKQQQQQPPPATLMMETASVPHKAAAARVVPAAASFRLEPLPLTEQQQRQLHLSAILRILHTDKTSRQQMRSALVAKLAAESEPGTMGPAIMQQLVQGIASSISISSAGADRAGGEVGAGSELEVALLWLNLLFARECQPSEARAAAAGSPHGKLDAQDAARQDCSAAPDGQQQLGGSTSSRFPHGRRVGAPPPRTYEGTLMQLLAGLRQAVPPSSRVLVRVLLDVPALPMPAIAHFLQRAIEGGTAEWVTLGLAAARDVMLYRPPSRPHMLHLVLDACCSPQAEVRSKAVRLVANRLFPHPDLSATIEQVAKQRLDAMLPPAPPAAQAAKDPVAVEEEPGASVATATGEPTPVVTQIGFPASSPPAEASAATVEDHPPDRDPIEQDQQELKQQQQQPPLQRRQEERFADEGGEQPPSGPSTSDAAQLCALYCALCTKKHSLLRHLFEVYARTSVGGRAAIQRNAGGLATTLGAGAPALLAVVQDPPTGSLPLVLQMLHVLTLAAVPPQLLVTACLQLYDSCKDARVLVPALRGIDRTTALRLLPALLDLQPEQLLQALQRLVAPLPPRDTPKGGADQAGQIRAAPAVVSPEELLSALHTLDHSKDSGLLRKMMQGVTVCISSPALFPPESLAACLNQLLTRVPLPQLFMRTVIQTVAGAPRLRTFVVGILRQLATKQIWKDTTQWKGWLMCAQQTIPDSFPALVALPSNVLGSAAGAMPSSIRQQLLEFAKGGSIAVPSATLAVLEQLQMASG